MSKRTHLSQILRLAGDNWSKSIVFSRDGLKCKTGTVCKEVAVLFPRNVKYITKNQEALLPIPMSEGETANHELSTDWEQVLGGNCCFHTSIHLSTIP